MNVECFLHFIGPARKDPLAFWSWKTFWSHFSGTGIVANIMRNNIWSSLVPPNRRIGVLQFGILYALRWQQGYKSTSCPGDIVVQGKFIWPPK